jgi:RND superfamily putative drug exporter
MMVGLRRWIWWPSRSADDPRPAVAGTEGKDRNEGNESNDGEDGGDGPADESVLVGDGRS